MSYNIRHVLSSVDSEGNSAILAVNAYQMASYVLNLNVSVMYNITVLGLNIEPSLGSLLVWPRFYCLTWRVTYFSQEAMELIVLLFSHLS